MYVCISISAFASLVNIYKGIISSTIGLNIREIIARIKKYKSTIKEKKKKHDEIGKILLAKINLDCIKGSTSSFLTNSYNERDYFLLINVLKEYDNVKEKINKLQSS